LEALPREIEALEAEQKQLGARMSGSDSYRNPPTPCAPTKRVADIETLLTAEARTLGSAGSQGLLAGERRQHGAALIRVAALFSWINSSQACASDGSLRRRACSAGYPYLRNFCS
jgi:hypothetical protein